MWPRALLKGNCGCCERTLCELFADDFAVDDLAENYTVPSGSASWSITGGALHTAGSRIKLNVVDPMDGDGARLSMTVNFGGAGTKTITWEVDVRDSPFHVLALQIKCDGDGVITWQLVDQGPSSITVLAGPEVLTDVDADTDFGAALCWDYSRLSAQCGEQWMVAEATGIGSGIAGLASTNSSILIKSLTLTKLVEGCPDCDPLNDDGPISEDCGGCLAEGGMPRQIQVDIAGISGTAAAESVNGTYLLDYGGDCCGWSNGFFEGFPEPVDSVVITACFGGPGGDDPTRWLIVELTATVNGHPFAIDLDWIFTWDHVPDCAELDGLVLEPNAGTSPTGGSDAGSTATIHLSSPPP